MQLPFNTDKNDIQEEDMTALERIYLLPSFSTLLEGFLIGVLIALIGAAGYTFFVFSMKDDRDAAAMRKHYVNPWDAVSGQDANAKPQRPPRSGNETVGLILLLAAILVLIVLILALNLGWIRI